MSRTRPALQRTSTGSDEPLPAVIRRRRVVRSRAIEQRIPRAILEYDANSQPAPCRIHSGVPETACVTNGPRIRGQPSPPPRLSAPVAWPLSPLMG